MRRHLASLLAFALLAEEVLAKGRKPRVEHAQLLEAFDAYLVDGVERLVGSISGVEEERLAVLGSLRLEVELVGARAGNVSQLLLERRGHGDLLVVLYCTNTAHRQRERNETTRSRRRRLAESVMEGLSLRGRQRAHRTLVQGRVLLVPRVNPRSTYVRQRWRGIAAIPRGIMNST